MIQIDEDIFYNDLVREEYIIDKCIIILKNNRSSAFFKYLLKRKKTF